MNQGTKWVLLMKKNKSQKSRASVPLTLSRHVTYLPPSRVSNDIAFQQIQDKLLQIFHFIVQCYICKSNHVKTMLSLTAVWTENNSNWLPLHTVSWCSESHMPYQATSQGLGSWPGIQLRQF